MQRLIDKTKVTCLQWLPNSPNLFLAAHSSGHLYLYNEELPCSPTAPVYQLFKSGDGYSVLTCKSKSTRNPLFKWSFGLNSMSNGSSNSSSSSSSSSSTATISSSSSSYSCASDNCSINEFSFSPCGTNLAIASQDGFLRVFHYESMELVGIARSYFGGFLCVCWSPDGKYIVVGGEDDLVTVYSFNEKRVVARGQGHRSWVSVVAFDPYTTLSSWDQNDFSDDENQYDHQNNAKRSRSASIRDSTLSAGDSNKLICYRLGSVSQDTQLCLWDITEDVLRPHHRVRLSTLDPTTGASATAALKSIASETVQMNGDVGGGSPHIIHKEHDNSLSNNSHTKLSNSNNKLITNNCEDVSGSSSTNNKKIIGNSSNNNNNLSATTKDTKSEEKSNSNHHHHSSAFNTLTQRLTNFSFGSDKNNSKNGSGGGKKGFSLTGSKANSVEQNKILMSTACDGNSAQSTLRNKSGSITTTFDAMKLIGTPACPRFDECPVLEPLICKKIAHERLTALIFREDCFLTACQDGFVYTWARPVSAKFIYLLCDFRLYLSLACSLL